MNVHEIEHIRFREHFLASFGVQVSYNNYMNETMLKLFVVAAGVILGATCAAIIAFWRAMK